MTMTAEVKKERNEARKLERKRTSYLETIEAEKNQKPVKAITISIEWKKSRMWRNNPHAMAEIEFHDGTFKRLDGFTCSGCGYDKESTVIAAIFNATLKYELYRRIRKEKPYGLYYYNGKAEDKDNYFRTPCYNGGVGTFCYIGDYEGKSGVAWFIGGKFEHISSGKTFDVYKYTDKKRRRKS